MAGYYTKIYPLCNLKAAPAGGHLPKNAGDRLRMSNSRAGLTFPRTWFSYPKQGLDTPF
jgi:hypothetical protein